MAVPRDYDPEHPVVDAIRAGDRYAFDELLQRHGRWVRGVIFGVLGDADRVDDVAQQVWTAVWERIGELRDVTRWRPWLYRLAHNAAIDAGREQTRRRKHQQRMLADPIDRSASLGSRGGDPGQQVVQSEGHRQALAAVQALPAIYREPFVLRHFNGWSYQQIADAMGMPVDSVETRLVRARRFLREALKDKVA